MIDRAAGRRLLVDVGPSVVLAVAATHELLYNHAPGWQWLTGEALVWLLALRRSAPEGVLAGTLLLAVVGWWQGDLLVAHLGVLVALHAVAAQRDRVRTLVAAAVVETAAIVVACEFAPTGSVNDGIVLLTALTLSAVLLGTTLRAHQQYTLALEERAGQLEREREHKAQLAAAEERSRIAREIHDIVAHSVSVMIALSEGAAATRDDHQAHASMRQVAATGREALGELRRVLSILHEPRDPAARSPQPSLEDLPNLVRDVELAGLPVELGVEGDPTGVSEGVQATVYRVVQESLTNTLKHARGASRSTVVVRIGEDVTVEVHDDGTGSAADDGEPTYDIESGNGNGNGIRGMNERAMLYGGRAQARTNGGGWTVTCTLPLDARAPA